MGILKSIPLPPGESSLPVTIAHAAAAPLLSRLTSDRLVMSAVVVGAMSPDFEYLIRLAPYRTIGHTPLGAFVFCLPASLAVLGIWHHLVGPALVPLLPDRPSPARPPFRFLPARRLVTICGSVLAGVSSHLLWDSFTHHDGFFVSRLGILSGPAWAGGPAGYVVAWNVSGLVGTAAVTWWLCRRCHLLPSSRRSSHAVPENVIGHPVRRRAARRLAGATVAAGAAGLATLNAVRHVATGASADQVLVAGVLGAMTGTAAATVMAGLVLRLRSAR